jgi:hypothetical protein
MNQPTLIEQLAEQQGRGHAELRRMAMLGVLKDAEGNLVTPEDLADDSPSKSESQEWIGRVDQAWESYQAAVQKLRAITGSTQAEEWDLTQAMTDRVSSVRLGVANIEVRDDEDWNEVCIDKAHELCIDLNYHQQRVLDLISAAEDEDQVG